MVVNRITCFMTLLSMMMLAQVSSAYAQQDDVAEGAESLPEDTSTSALVVQKPDVGVPDVNARAGGERPTIQNRFASKKRLLVVQPLLMTHVRDDFYNSWGGGADLSYYFTERWGLELRAVFLRTTLDAAAFDIKERFGIVPDARPQNRWLNVGVRYSPGYGKFLMWDNFVVHFDPQLVLHAGVASADRRLLPGATAAFSLMTHWRWGIKAKVDLGISVQGEQRERGWVLTTGFAPVLGVGWGRNF